LFSSWYNENDEIWAANAARLSSYREVEPLPFVPDAGELDNSDETELADYTIGGSQAAGVIEDVGPDDGDYCEIPF
jgi:hypothetical protein